MRPDKGKGRLSCFWPLLALAASEAAVLPPQPKEDTAMRLDAFGTNGSSPPILPTSRRYRLRVATWTVVREAGAPPLPRRLSSPHAAFELAREWFRLYDDEREHFVVLMLDTQNGLRLVHEVSVGTISSTLVHPREVFGPALREGAAALILLHNHPSGNPEPSCEDMRLTRQLVQTGELVDVKVHDHVIVGSGTWQFVSFAQRGLL
jgi:DNA repair protein RadC